MKNFLTPIPDLKALYDQTEAFWTRPLQVAMGTESFTGLMETVRESTLTQQQAMRQNLDTCWEQLRLPNRTDLSRLAELSVGLESRVERLEDRLDGIENQLAVILDAVMALGQRPEAAASVSRKPQDKQK